MAMPLAHLSQVSFILLMGHEGNERQVLSQCHSVTVLPFHQSPFK